MKTGLRLGHRLLLGHLLVLTIGGMALVLTIGGVSPSLFETAMGHAGGMTGMGDMMSDAVRAAFGEAVGTSVLVALALAGTAAVLASVLLAAQLGRRVGRLAAASRRVAGGHYAERVPVSGNDELDDLARSFNQMAASLEATEMRRLELVGDVAHELRTPIGTLDGYLEGLQDGVIEPSPRTWRLLRGETARLARLVNDLRDLWNAEARQLPVSVGIVDAGTFLAEVHRRFAPAALDRSIELSIVAPHDLLLRADPERLAQVVDNLVANALRYSPEGSRVELAARGEPDRVVLSVQDHGPGLTEEQRERIFERFYRADPSRSRALGGAGIGLAIARAITELMDGRIWAESEGPGRGATVHVAMPRAGTTGTRDAEVDAG